MGGFLSAFLPAFGRADLCVWRSYDLTASCKAFRSYQGRAAETASSIAGFLIERLEILLCSLHETAF